MIIYQKEFKEQCFQVLRFVNNGDLVVDLMDALEKNDHTKVRYCLEEALDDDSLYEEGLITDEGERIVDNARKYAYLERRELYSIFMEQLTEELDLEENGRGRIKEAVMSD